MPNKCTKDAAMAYDGLEVNKYAVQVYRLLHVVQTDDSAAILL